MSVSSVSVPRAFIADFALVTNHYQLQALGEFDEAKAAVKRDTASAITTYATLANEIRRNAAWVTL